MDEGILAKPYIGTVMKVDSDNRKVAVFIPNLMPTMQAQKSTSYSVPTNSGLKLQALSNSVSATVRKTNFVWVRNWYKNDPMPKEGSKVIVYFIDGNVLLGFWKKFDPNGDFEPIDSEKYRRILDLSINGSDSQVYDQDAISLTLPANFKAVLSNSEKTKSISIQENYSFYKGNEIIKAINDLQKSVEYLSGLQTETMLSGFDSIQCSSITDSDIKTKVQSDISSGKKAISGSDNMLDAKAAYDAYFGMASAESTAFYDYLSYKSKYEAASESDRSALDAAFGSSYASEIESSLAAIKKNILSASNANDAGIIRSLDASYFPSKIIVAYDYYSNKANGIEETRLLSEGDAFSQYSEPVITGICHFGILSSVVSSGWKSSDGVDPAAAKILYRSIELEPILFGLYAEEGDSEKSIIVNVCDDPGYDYTATMKVGTADPISVTSFPVSIVSGDNKVVFEIKHSDIDLTLTISA